MTAADRVLVGIGAVLVILGGGLWSYFFVHPGVYGEHSHAARFDVALYGIGIAMLGAARLLSGIRSIFSR